MTAAPATEFDPAPVLAKLKVKPRRITADSRCVEEGSAFAAYPGAKLDGRAFIPDAVARGAGAVMWEPHGFHWDTSLKVPNVAIDGLQTKLGWIADFVYGHPSAEILMIGVTGTNGKTSCSQWIAQAFAGTGRRVAVLGTLGTGFFGALTPAPNTTPDGALLQETLRSLVDRGAEIVAMEVSSIGLDQGRVNGTHFDIALFTNLTRDHLDYHGTMTAYGAAKARLFAWPGLSGAVINAEDAFGQSLIESARARGTAVLTYGASASDVAAVSERVTSQGLLLEVATPWGRGEVQTRIVGAFNVHNLLGTLGVLLVAGMPFATALPAVGRLAPPPGRMQRHGGAGKPLVVIDYAHTADALEKVLEALRPAVGKGGALICVFGCGGDRDKGKRAEMGRIASTLADRVVVTSDNPRSEDPAAIASAIVHGVRAAGNRRWTVELDRTKAIELAIREASAQDVVVLAGKGHETCQEANGVRTPFNDAVAADSALAGWSAS